MPIRQDAAKAHRQQRMAPEGEEVVVDSDPVHLEQRGPDARQQLFRRGAGGDDLRTVAITSVLGLTLYASLAPDGARGSASAFSSLGWLTAGLLVVLVLVWPHDVLRLATGNPDARALFESEGFRHRLSVTGWSADRLEGGEPARIPPASDAERVLRALQADPALAAYDGLDALPSGPRDVDRDYVTNSLERGTVREGAGGRALLLAGPGFGGRRLHASLVTGSGAALQDLLMALRFEADADGLEGAGILAPHDHPAQKDFESVGYDPDGDWEFSILDLTL